MQEGGLGESEVLKILEKKLGKDATYRSGRILSSMCSEPLDVAKKAYNFALEKNLGDEFLFPAAAALERETVSMLGDLLSNPRAVGHIVSGGTEANVTALWVAQHLSRSEKREVILPESAHFSFQRAADILNLKLVKIPLTREYRIDVSKVKKAVNRKTLALVGVAGTTGLGVVDAIPELSEISLEHDVHLHIDAAFGGFVLPFLKDMGLYEGGFDFASTGVKSITVDPHKMGLCPIPAGGVLFRDSSLLSAVSLSVDYIGQGEMKFTTLSCTRPASPTVAVWAAMKSLGRNGYRAVVKKCMANTLMLAEDLKSLDGVKMLIKPAMNIVGFTCSKVNSNQTVFKELSKRGWLLSLFPTHIRVVVMPHIDAPHLKVFVSDLKEVLTESGGS